MDHRAELIDVIRRVRNRWRLRLALRGAVVVVAGTLLALLLSASGLESFRFSAPSIIAFRLISVAVFVGLLCYGLIWPLRRRVTELQVALYLEERDPTLEAAIISAVDATTGGGSEAHSPRLVEKLVEQATDQCRALDHGRTIDRTSVQRHATTLAGIAAAGAIALALWDRRRSGRGQYVEVAQRENLINMIGEQVVAYSMTGREPPRRGNRDSSMAPHGCYPCRGDDQWLTIACEDDAQFAALCLAMGRPELASDARFADVVSRYRNQDALDGEIARWTRERSWNTTRPGARSCEWT